jgi:hypothetical protein
MKHKLIMENWKRYLVEALSGWKGTGIQAQSGNINAEIYEKGQEVILVDVNKFKYEGMRQIWTAQGAGIGWLVLSGSDQGVHLHPTKGGHLPSNLKVPFQHKYYANKLKQPAPKPRPHEQER